MVLRGLFVCFVKAFVVLFGGVGSNRGLPVNWMILPLKRYADFTGRSRRKEFWMFQLFQILVLTLLAVLYIAFLGLGYSASDPFAVIPLLIISVSYVLGFLIPNIAVQVRRFHDQDLSGWLILLGFIPYVGGLILLVFMCRKGTRGPNRFGPDPKDPYCADIFA